MGKDTDPSTVLYEQWRSMTDLELAARLYVHVAGEKASEVFFEPFRELYVFPRPSSVSERVNALVTDSEQLRAWAFEVHLVEPEFPEGTVQTVFVETLRSFSKEMRRSTAWLERETKSLQKAVVERAIKRGSELEDEVADWAKQVSGDEAVEAEMEEEEEPPKPFEWEVDQYLVFDPRIETLDEAVARLRANFERTLWMFQLRCVGRSSDEAVELYASTRGFSLAHFEWLVLRQLYGWSNKKIESEVHRSESAIRSGIRKAASLMGVAFSELRKIPRGRPKGVKETGQRIRPQNW